MIGWIMWGQSGVILLLMALRFAVLAFPHVAAALSPNTGAGAGSTPLSELGQATAMLAFYGCTFAGSRAFLSLRAWGRVAVEAFLCLFTLVLLIRVVYAIMLLTANPSAIAATLAIALAFVAVPVLAVVALHKPAVRDAFAAAKAAREAQR
ncbi:MAG TPA: hypothetical protein VHP11_18280 [Tepidisphaeraceae bacterium]|nr:hypothetical protein [Tepidisphaeraceae bacterium]